MTSEKHIHMDTTSAAAIEISKRRAPLDSNSYYNLFPGFLCPCVFPLLRALVQQRTRHWCHLVLSQILRANLCHLWTVVKISLSKRGMWLTSDGVTGSEFRFLSFVWSKMLAGLDWDIWEKTQPVFDWVKAMTKNSDSLSKRIRKRWTHAMCQHVDSVFDHCNPGYALFDRCFLFKTQTMTVSLTLNSFWHWLVSDFVAPYYNCAIYILHQWDVRVCLRDIGPVYPCVP